MLDLRDQQKGGFRAFAQRDAQRREERDAAHAAGTAVDVTTDSVPAPDAPDAPVYGPRLVKRHAGALITSERGAQPHAPGRHTLTHD